MKKIITSLLLLATSSIISAQSSLDSILASVLKNNKTLAAYTQYNTAQTLQYKTGLTPSDPVAEYDYLFGNNTAIGDQVEFSITQSFDFPTVYGKRKDVSESNIAQLEFKMIAQRQDILFDAETVYLEIIYRNKLNLYYQDRKNALEKLVTDFKTKLDKGDGNILDVNKSRLNLIEINKLYNENISTASQLHQHLIELNGGVTISISDTLYPVAEALSPFEVLEQEYEKNDPFRKILEQEKIIAQRELELRKALWLPKVETGYHYQGFLGETYQGIHAGISIPLWENKNIVSAQESYIAYTDVNLQSHINEHYYEIKEMYERYFSLTVSLEEYRKIFDDVSNKLLLDKALELGQINVIEYFLEISFFDDALMNYLETENEYYKIIALLNKYKL
ncbi:MAG: TolC family protein [Fimbriimonadaceae bacterium]|nr:TolC family protein [Chitinophagales bacterium]